MKMETVKMTDEEYKDYLKNLKLVIKGATNHPDGVRYRIEIKCTAGNCKEVRNYMTEQGFEVIKEESLNSDHYGIKRYKTPEKAIKAMNDINEKYNKSLDKPKIEFASVLPLIPYESHLDKK